MSNKDIAIRFSKAFHTQDISAVREIVAENYIFKGPLMQMNGRDELIDFIQNKPFACREEDSRYIEDGDTVVKVCSVSFSQPFQGIIPMCEVMSVENGKITKAELFYDSALFPKTAC